MGILERISTIMRSNINALLDQAEDPEKVLDQILRDMASAIGEARGQVAMMIAEQKKLERDLDDARRVAADWNRKAELAVTKGDDELAREALKRKRDYGTQATLLTEQYTTQSEAVTRLKNELKALETKYEDAKRNRDILIARRKRAKAQEAVTRVARGMTTFDPTADLSRMEDRIEREEAMAAANAELSADSLDNRFSALEQDSEVEDELAALKARIGGSTAATAPVDTTR